MKDKKGRVVVGILLFLVLVVVVSSAVLLLVQSGVLIPKDYEEVSLVNVNFIPFEREDTLVIKDVELCVDIEDDLECFFPTDEFYIGDDVYVRVMVESPTISGAVNFGVNYRMIDPLGRVVLELDEQESYTFNEQSSNGKETVVVADAFTTDFRFVSGEYTLEVIVDNPLLQKKVVRSVVFNLEELEDEGDYEEEYLEDFEDESLDYFEDDYEEFPGEEV